ncbi:MAG: hypothetical protein HGB20_10575, partial [Chlorobiaceae bacterium]|nr:hypothetical protein [Chlorobiaceae bacterium]
SLGSRQTVTTDNYGMSQKIEYRVTPKVYIEASRSTGQLTNSISNSSLQKPTETWGVSVSYKERFRSWDEFWKHLVPSSDKNR